MSPGGLCQVNSRTYSVVSWPKDHVVDPRARILEMQAPLCLFLELGNHLPHNICLEDFSRQARKHKLSSRRHYHPKHGKPHSHLSMAGDRKPHSLMQGALQRGADYCQAQLKQPDAQKSKLLVQAFTLSLGLFTLLIGVSRLVLGLAHNSKLTLEKVDLSSHLTSFPMSRSQQDDTFLGHPRTRADRVSAMMAATHAPVTSSLISAISATSWAKRCVKSSENRTSENPKRTEETQVKLFSLGLTLTGCRTSRPTMTIIFCSSHPVAATREHASSALLPPVTSWQMGAVCRGNSVPLA
jgi:hypothetical protein